jgi:hypothetical protein
MDSTLYRHASVMLARCVSARRYRPSQRARGRYRETGRGDLAGVAAMAILCGPAPVEALRSITIQGLRRMQMTYYSKIIESPVGELTLVASDKGLAAILWENDNPLRVRLSPVV